MAGRTYRLQKRALSQAETRDRIVRATSDLHRTIGPAATTISAIAERAGVRRLTVYRHFPDESALVGACGADWRTRHPLPSPDAWLAISDPRQRTRAALRDLYAYFEETGEMMENVLRDAPGIPALAAAVQDYAAYFDSIARMLIETWQPPEARAPHATAAIRLALDFHVWLAMSRQALAPEEAAALMTQFVEATVTGCAE